MRMDHGIERAKAKSTKMTQRQRNVSVNSPPDTRVPRSAGGSCACLCALFHGSLHGTSIPAQIVASVDPKTSACVSLWSLYVRAWLVGFRHELCWNRGLVPQLQKTPEADYPLATVRCCMVVLSRWADHHQRPLLHSQPPLSLVSFSLSQYPTQSSAHAHIASATSSRYPSIN